MNQLRCCIYILACNHTTFIHAHAYKHQQNPLRHVHGEATNTTQQSIEALGRLVVRHS